MSIVRRLAPRRAFALASLTLIVSGMLLPGCGGGAVAPPQSDAQERASKLMNLYRAYVDKNKKGPPDEQSLRDFGAKLTAEEKSGYLVGDDLENIFTSPRDQKKFKVRWGIKPDPAVTRALIWEETGQNGMHVVALTNYYVVEYDEQQLKDYTK